MAGVRERVPLQRVCQRLCNREFTACCSPSREIKLEKLCKVDQPRIRMSCVAISVESYWQQLRTCLTMQGCELYREQAGSHQIFHLCRWTGDRRLLSMSPQNKTASGCQVVVPCFANFIFDALVGLTQSVLMVPRALNVVRQRSWVTYVCVIICSTVVPYNSYSVPFT